MTLLLLPARPAAAQQWTGSAGIDVLGGYQTNPYLDSDLGAWDPNVDPAYASLSPSLGVARVGRRLRLNATLRARWFAGRPSAQGALPFAQVAVAGRYELSPRWTAGLLGGATRYRLGSDRDTGWLLPTVRFQPGDDSRITLRVGASQRAERTVTPADRQTSAIATLSGQTWLTDRLQGTLRLYRSAGQTGATDAGFGATGAEARLSVWPTASLVVEGSIAAEQLRYDVTRDGTTTQTNERILQGGLEARWQVHPNVTAFARTGGLTADLARSTVSDADVSAGVQVRLQRVLAGSTPTPTRRRLWRATGDGLRFEVPYEGDGTLYVTGDFNGWSLPGIPLSETDDDTWTATLDLSPGRYTYRIRVVTGDGARWLPFPAYAQTTDDDFGGVNGVCIVE